MKLIHACAAGLAAAGFVVTPAFATAPSGLGVTGIINGSYGALSMNTAGDKTDKWGLILKTLDDTDIGADRVSLGAGGYTGWHAHPGPVFVTVTVGSITWYDGSNPLCTPHTFTVGQSFIEPAYKVHNAKNPNATGAEFVAVSIKPAGFVGPAFVLDRDEPTNCSF